MPSPFPGPAPRPKLLVLEFWGLGDLSFATAFLSEAVKAFDVTLAGKPHAEKLLAPTFPGVRFLACDPPWTAFRNKYRLWKWDWRALLRLLWALRRSRFDAAVSVRKDPRDHLLMFLSGARRRLGFPKSGSRWLLNCPMLPPRASQHKVEDWRELGAALGLPGARTAQPRLAGAAYRTARAEALLAGIERPILALHPGARIPVRRWPEANFAALIRRLRAEFDFHLLLFTEPDGYGRSLEPLADSLVPPVEVGELVYLLSRVDLLLCNDSGPGHLAASCGRPVAAIFGPTDPGMFRPWGDQHYLGLRDLCVYRPCFDYCRFPEPYCLTRLPAEELWPELRAHLRQLGSRGLLRPDFFRGEPSLAAGGGA